MTIIYTRKGNGNTTVSRIRVNTGFLQSCISDTCRETIVVYHKIVHASFQYTAVKTLVDATVKAVDEFQPASVVIAGGVAANSELRRQLSERLPLPIEYAPSSLCTDNGAMIAALGYYHAQVVPPTPVDNVTVRPSISMKDTVWNKA